MATEPQTKYWTYEDLLALPDDGRRYEIIEGVLYEMPSPNMEHGDLIANLLHRVFWPVVDALGGRVYTAPIDVFLPGAQPVQPDVFVLMPEQLVLRSRRGVEGPPALIVEVLSPGNSRHDLVRKRAIYARAGVREYWIVSPEALIIEILALEGNTYRTHARVAGDELLTSTVLPMLSCAVSVVFEI
jgi:Uma2 family endonuclease